MWAGRPPLPTTRSASHAARPPHAAAGRGSPPPGGRCAPGPEGRSSCRCRRSRRPATRRAPGRRPRRGGAFLRRSRASPTVRPVCRPSASISKRLQSTSSRPEVLGHQLREVDRRGGEEHHAVAPGTVPLQGRASAGPVQHPHLLGVEGPGPGSQLLLGKPAQRTDGGAERVVHRRPAQLVAGHPHRGAEELPAGDVPGLQLAADPEVAGVADDQGLVEVEEGNRSHHPGLPERRSRVTTHPPSISSPIGRCSARRAGDMNVKFRPVAVAGLLALRVGGADELQAAVVEHPLGDLSPLGAGEHRRARVRRVGQADAVAQLVGHGVLHVDGGAGQRVRSRCREARRRW